MATTLESIVDEVLLTLEGFTGDTGSVVGQLLNLLTDVSTSFAVDVPPSEPEGSPLSAGLVEVGDELVNAVHFDRLTGVFTSVVRGWRGSTAVAHPAGSVVRSNPRYPRFQVVRAVNDTARALFPRISAVETVQLRTTGNRVRYELPAGTVAVHRISYEQYGGSKRWPAVQDWRFVQDPAGEFADSAAIEIHGIPTGRSFQVVVFKEPGVMSDPADTLESKAGLGSYTRPVLVAGAVYRLFSTVELGRALQTTVSQQMLNTQSSVGAATRLAGQLQTNYSMELTAATNKFDAMYPAARHSTW
jgi:hypothetical protein